MQILLDLTTMLVIVSFPVSIGIELVSNSGVRVCGSFYFLTNYRRQEIGSFAKKIGSCVAAFSLQCMTIEVMEMKCSTHYEISN